jgi:hypothetical protein
MTETVTRKRVEELLTEISGFDADQADLAAAMLVIDAYAASLAENPGPAAEAHLHLLVQQAELLLDQGTSVAVLASRVQELTALVTAAAEQMQGRIDRLAADLEDLKTASEITPAPLPEEARQVVRTWEEQQALLFAKITAPADLPEETQETPLEEWERDLLKGKIPTVADALQCHLCGQWKPATTQFWFRNGKSPTGWETRCRACRPPKRRAA